MSSKNSDEEPDSPPIIVRRKILDSPSEITNKKDYERILKVTTRKRSLSASKSTEQNVDEIKREPSPKKKKQKIKHESSDSESSESSSKSDPQRGYYCEHINCLMCLDGKTALRKHTADFKYHEEHFGKYQLFCNACKEQIQAGVWDDTHGQNMISSARSRKADMKQLIKRLKVLHEKKIQFKKAEEEFIYRHQYFTPETGGHDDSPRGDRLPKYGASYMKLKLPTGHVQEFPLLTEKWKQQNLFGIIVPTEMDPNIPINAEHLIERVEEDKDYNLLQLYEGLQQMRERYDLIKNDDLYKQWLMYNMCQLQIFLQEKKFVPVPQQETKASPAISNVFKSESRSSSDPAPEQHSQTIGMNGLEMITPELLKEGFASGVYMYLRQQAAANPVLQVATPQPNPVQIPVQVPQLPPLNPLQALQHLMMSLQQPLQMPLQAQAPLQAHPMQLPLQQPNPVQQIPQVPNANAPDLSQFANISPAYLRSLAAMLEQQRQ
jgi:hypothetical protein